jgi:stress-induced morphogen
MLFIYLILIKDANPAEVEATANSFNPTKILNTNFKILIVSNAFDRLNTIERIELVYEELLNLLGSHLIPSADHKDKFHSVYDFIFISPLCIHEINITIKFHP